jgi:pyridoxamine 5'-phosphate oxidase-like protein
VDLTGPECWKLLSSVPLGRVVFSQDAMPAIRVVSHLVEDGAIIIRSPQGAVIAGQTRLAGSAAAGRGVAGTVVCYEADAMDTVRRTGWSVVVTGMARLVRDPAALARYSRLLSTWAADGAGDVVAIEPGIVSGRRVIDD